MTKGFRVPHVVHAPRLRCEALGLLGSRIFLSTPPSGKDGRRDETEEGTRSAAEHEVDASNVTKFVSL